MFLGCGYHLGLKIILPVIEYVLLACVVMNYSECCQSRAQQRGQSCLSIPPLGAQSHLPVSSSGDLAEAML